MTTEELWDRAEHHAGLKTWKLLRRISPVFLHNISKDKIVDHTKFKNILNVYFTLVTKIMIETGYFYAMPYRLGEMGITKYKVKGKKLID